MKFNYVEFQAGDVEFQSMWLLIELILLSKTDGQNTGRKKFKS